MPVGLPRLVAWSSGQIDNTTWQALGLTLTVIGLLPASWSGEHAAAVRAPRCRLVLLPLAAALTGTLRLLWEIADAVADWAVRLVFSPVVWTRCGRSPACPWRCSWSRPRARRGSGGRRPAGRADAADARLDRDRASRPSRAEDDDMADIEALLKKHGIA